MLSGGDWVGDAPSLAFVDVSAQHQSAHFSGFLTDPGDIQLAQLTLDAGDLVSVAVDTAPYGGGLDSYLRVFQATGLDSVRQIASNDNFRGHDAGLTFQAPGSGVYYIGISAHGNTTYDPLVPGSGNASASSFGLFDLTVSRSAAAAAAPALVAASLETSQILAVWGDTITLTYTIENRGADDGVPTTVTLLASADNRFQSAQLQLQTTVVPSLSASESYTASFTVELGSGGAPWASYLQSQQIFLGLKIGDAPPTSPEGGNDWTTVNILARVDAATAANSTLDTALAIPLASRTTTGPLSPGGSHFYQIAPTQAGNVHALIKTTAGRTLLSLLDAQGRPIVQSDGRSADDPDPLITHGLLGSTENGGTTYYLRVDNPGDIASTYELTTLFTPSVSVLASVPLAAPIALVSGDFNGDAIADLAVVPQNSFSLVTLLGNGDGTFQRAGSFGTGLLVATLATGDFNNDGRLDLVVANAGSSGVALLLGNGDGTFVGAAEDASLLLAETGGAALAVGDFNNDGNADIALGDANANQVRVLLGNGHAGFQSVLVTAAPGVPTALVVADFNGDGGLDVAVTAQADHQVRILLGNKDGTFTSAASVAVGPAPLGLAAGDFNRDGRRDLAVVSATSNNVTVLLGDGTGGFQSAGAYAAGTQPRWLVTADFNGDGRLDLGTTNSFSNDITVLLGDGNGAFTTTQPFAVGANPLALVAADFNGDACVDVASVNYESHDVTVLLGNGNGTFPQPDTPNRTGEGPDALAQGDFNGDGRLDLAVANSIPGTVSVLLGQGDGTFARAGDFAAGAAPVALVAGDFNGDSRLDLAVANYGSDDMTVLLGIGAGAFASSSVLSLGGKPSALVADDFNDDGYLDLAVALQFTPEIALGNTVKLLLGDGQGAFQEVGDITTGSRPQGLVSGDFNGDGNLDLATANNNYYGDHVTVALGDGLGQFSAPVSYSLPNRAVGLVLGDFNGDTHLDLAVASQSYYYSTVTLLWNDGHGNFLAGDATTLDKEIKALAAGDFDGDGNLDLAAAHGRYLTYPYSFADNVTVLLGNGAGTFNHAALLPTGTIPFSLLAEDLNSDGRLDLAVANLASADVTVLLGAGGGDFVSSALAPSLVQSTPLVANLSGNLDTVVLAQNGQILFRQGLPEQPGVFAPPLVLNPDPAMAARDLALVETDGGLLLAALSANSLPQPGGSLVARPPRVMFYQFRDGAFANLPELPLPADFLPASLASQDLNGDGLGDLVITAASSDQVLVSLQTAPGIFAPATPYTVGVNPSDIAFAHLNDDAFRDIVVTNRFSGQVSVLANDGNGGFSAERRFRAGTGLYGLSDVNGAVAVHSLEGTSGIVTGAFDAHAGDDAVIINSGTNRIVLLSGDGLGGFYNPNQHQTFLSASSPTAIVADCFITGDSNLHLAVLEKDAVSLYRGDGLGGFTRIFTGSAGNQPTGLAAADVTRPGGGGPDGILDLLIGNALGDLLILAGDGNGSFSEYRRADQKVSLTVAGANADAERTFFFSNQGVDRLSFASAPQRAAIVADPTVYQNREAGVQAPGPQTIVTVGDTQYLVVANRGANNVLIYTIGADGTPVADSKQTYFTGTDPVSLTIASADTDLNGDDIPDLVVANQGSNDVSIFLGGMTGDTWTLAYRPRQSSGGFGPTSVAISDVVGAGGFGVPDGSPDLLVSNGQSDQVSILPSRGAGFFINQPAFVFATGIAPTQLFVGDFDGTGDLDLVTVNTGSSSVTVIKSFLSVDRDITTVSSGGLFPVAARMVSLNADGISDLLVANTGDGTLGVFLGGVGGLELTATVNHVALPHLSDLALVTTGPDLEVYGTDAGRDIAVLLGTFGPAPEPPIFVPQGPGFHSSLELTASPTSFEVETGTPVVFYPGSGASARRFTPPGTSVNGLATLALFNALLLGPAEGFNGPEGRSEEDQEGRPPAALQNAPGSSDSPAVILLQNLTEELETPQSVGPTPRNAPSDPMQDEDESQSSAHLETVSLELANALRATDPLTPVPPFDQAAPIQQVSPLDYLWQTQAAEWTLWDGYSTPTSDPSTVTEAPLPLPHLVLAAPAPHAAPDVPAIQHPHAGSCVNDGPSPCTWRDYLAFAGLWSVLPLIVVEKLKPLRRPWEEVKLLLQRLWG